MGKYSSFFCALSRTFTLLLVASFTICLADEYNVIITGDSSVVIGGTVEVKAELLDGTLPARGQFQYEWKDNAIPFNTKTEQSNLPVSFWNVTYSSNKYAPGPYNLEVNVAEKNWWGGYSPKTSQRFAFDVTLYLSGQLSLSQSGEVRDSAVAVSRPVQHTVTLSHPDQLYVRKHKNKVVSYWFVDCAYVGPVDGLSSSWNYTQVDSTHDVTAIVVASYVPPPPPPTTTSTTTPPTTTTSSTTLTTTTTTSKPTTTAVPVTTKAPSSNISGNATTVSQPPPTLDPFNVFLASFPRYNASQPPSNLSGTCFNMSSIPMSDNSTYGLFQKKLVAKAPVRVTVNGTNWLRDGDMFTMNVTSNGSAPLTYCILPHNGLYNVTGNETCENPLPLLAPSMHFSHLFKEPAQYTFVVIVQNAVSRTVTPVGVNVYQVKKQPQISVIVVPVAFSIVAVVLIVSGVAWYVHTRRTFPVEVADFDFGHQSTDMEYKTFRERLRESVMASFFRTADPQDPRGSPTRKYGSMP